MSKRHFVRGSLVVAPICLCVTLSARAQTPAQDFPSKPIRLIVPNAPDAGTDIVTRLIALRFSECWKMQPVMENRPGGNTIIGTDLVAKFSPDGYTLLMTYDPMSAIANMYTRLPYDPRVGIVVPFAAGGSTDLLARSVAPLAIAIDPELFSERLTAEHHLCTLLIVRDNARLTHALARNFEV